MNSYLENLTESEIIRKIEDFIALRPIDALNLSPSSTVLTWIIKNYSSVIIFQESFYEVVQHLLPFRFENRNNIQSTIDISKIIVLSDKSYEAVMEIIHRYDLYRLGDIDLNANSITKIGFVLDTSTKRIEAVARIFP